METRRPLPRCYVMKTTYSLRTAALGALFAGAVGSSVGAYFRPEGERVVTGQRLVVTQPVDSSLGYFDGPVWPGDSAAYE